MKDLSDKVIMEAMKREDRRATPLIVDLAEMTRYYPLEYLLKKMEEHYDGRETYTEREDRTIRRY